MARALAKRKESRERYCIPGKEANHYNARAHGERKRRMYTLTHTAVTSRCCCCCCSLWKSFSGSKPPRFIIDRVGFRCRRRQRLLLRSPKRAFVAHCFTFFHGCIDVNCTRFLPESMYTGARRFHFLRRLFAMVFTAFSCVDRDSS